MNSTLKSKWVVSEVLLCLRQFKSFRHPILLWFYQMRSMAKRLEHFSLHQTMAVKWREQRPACCEGLCFIARGPCSHSVKAEGWCCRAGVATSLPSVAAQAFSLKRRPGGPWGIIEENHVKVEMRKIWRINTKACVSKDENAASAEIW